MVLPKYLESQWYAEGKALLKFHPKLDPASKDRPKLNPVNEKSPISEKELGITCHMSSLVVWEYKEKEQPPEEDHATCICVECISARVSGSEEYVCPPEVSQEIWMSWFQWWAYWKDTYVHLSWIEKFRNLCRQEDTDWHDTFIKNFPRITPIILDSLGDDSWNTSANKDAHQCKQNNSDSQNKGDSDDITDTDSPNLSSGECKLEIGGKLDKMFKEFARWRYWIPLRAYLQLKKVEASEDLCKFFSENGNIDYLKACNTSCSYNDDIPDFMKNASLDLMLLFGLINEGETSDLSELKPSVSNEDNLQVKTEEYSYDKIRLDSEADKLIKDSEGKVEQNIQYYSVKQDSEADKVKQDNEVDKVEQDNEADKAEQGSEADSVKQVCEADKVDIKVEQDSEADKVEHDSEVDKVDIKDEEPENGIMKDENRKGAVDIYEEMEKIGLKRPQEYLYVGGKQEDGENEVKKRPRHNPLVERNIENVQTKEEQKGKKESDEDDSEVELDPEDKENSAVTGSSSKTKKKKKKQMDSRGYGVGWALKYFGKIESPQTNGEELQEDNIFSVTEGHNAIHKTHVGGINVAGLAEEVSFLASLPSDDYEFSADRLNLKEDTVKLSNCFKVKDDAVFDNDLKEDTYESADGFEIECSSDNDRESDFEDDKPEEVERSSGEEYNSKTVCMSQNSEKRTWLSFLPYNFYSLKDFIFLCASNFVSFFVTTVSQGPKMFVKTLSYLPYLRRLYATPASKEVQRAKKKSKPTCVKDLEKWLQQSSNHTVCPDERYCLEDFLEDTEDREMLSLYQSVEMQKGSDGCLYSTLKTLSLDDLYDICYSDDEYVPWWKTQIIFDKEGNPIKAPLGTKEDIDHESDDNEEYRMWKRVIAGHTIMTYRKNDNIPPEDLPEILHKYWAQRHRLFLRYDEGIKLDDESWYSVTPELFAAHHANRCQCNVVVDAFCGSGGNAIHLANTCKKVIAIDIDPAKIELAKNNAAVYGVANRITFLVGDFFELAPQLNADVVFLSPPWGGTKYLSKKVYNVKKLGGVMDCGEIMKAARLISNDIALYLPRSSDQCQVIELAGLGGCVDVEYNYIGKKKKALTAYYGGLVKYNENSEL